MKKVLLLFLILIMATMYSFPVSAIEYIDVKSSIFLSSYEARACLKKGGDCAKATK